MMTPEELEAELAANLQKSITTNETLIAELLLCIHALSSVDVSMDYIMRKSDGNNVARDWIRERQASVQRDAAECVRYSNALEAMNRFSESKLQQLTAKSTNKEHNDGTGTQGE